jgi:EF-P beta-lysylation protein EpmB
MIPRTEPQWQATTVIEHTPSLDKTQDWGKQLASAVRNPTELFALLNLDPAQLPAALAASTDFALRVPRYFVDLMEVGNPHDPLLLQVLPQGAELLDQVGFVADPLDEQAANQKPGLIHKYHGRVLLIASGGCAINCRYCFRRVFPYGENNPSRADWAATLDYIRDDTSIEEVILSGGDPLTLTDAALAELLEQIAAIPHIQRLRIHTRLPVVLPDRITPRLIELLASPRFNTVMVIHANHPHEITAQLGAALAPLQQRGVILLNQSVLLKGVNDDVAILSELSQRLFAIGVLPYYLHLLDRVVGSAHFEVSEADATLLYRALATKLPGYLLPRLAREEAGKAAKTVLAPVL